MKYWILAIAFSIIGTLALATLAGVPNFQNPRADVYTSGQPDEAGFRILAEKGIKTVINVLPERQTMQEEASLVARNKMVYRSVPFDLISYRRATIDQFARVLKTSPKPVLIHCSTGNHVGGMWFAYRVLIEKAPLAYALEEGRQIGMKPFLEGSLLQWVRGQAKLQTTHNISNDNDPVR